MQIFSIIPHSLCLFCVLRSAIFLFFSFFSYSLFSIFFAFLLPFCHAMPDTDTHSAASQPAPPHTILDTGLWHLNPLSTENILPPLPPLGTTSSSSVSASASSSRSRRPGPGGPCSSIRMQQSIPNANAIPYVNAKLGENGRGSGNGKVDGTRNVMERQSPTPMNKKEKKRGLVLVPVQVFARTGAGAGAGAVSGLITDTETGTGTSRELVPAQHISDAGAGAGAGVEAEARDKEKAKEKEEEKEEDQATEVEEGEQKKEKEVPENANANGEDEKFDSKSSGDEALDTEKEEIRSAEKTETIKEVTDPDTDNNKDTDEQDCWSSQVALQTYIDRRLSSFSSSSPEIESAPSSRQNPMRPNSRKRRDTINLQVISIDSSSSTPPLTSSSPPASTSTLPPAPTDSIPPRSKRSGDNKILGATVRLDLGEHVWGFIEFGQRVRRFRRGRTVTNAVADKEHEHEVQDGSRKRKRTDGEEFSWAPDSTAKEATQAKSTNQATVTGVAAVEEHEIGAASVPVSGDTDVEMVNVRGEEDEQKKKPKDAAPVLEGVTGNPLGGTSRRIPESAAVEKPVMEMIATRFSLFSETEKVSLTTRLFLLFGIPCVTGSLIFSFTTSIFSRPFFRVVFLDLLSLTSPTLLASLPHSQP